MGCVMSSISPYQIYRLTAVHEHPTNYLDMVHFRGRVQYGASAIVPSLLAPFARSSRGTRYTTNLIQAQVIS